MSVHTKQFRAQTRVGQRPLPRKTFETVELTGAALAVLLMYNPEPRQGKRRLGASPERRELAGCSAGWSHDSASGGRGGALSLLSSGCLRSSLCFENV